MLWGNNYEKPITAAYKTIRIINDVSFQDHITPHYVNLVLLKFRDVVKVYTCLFLYDHLCDKKPCNFSTPTTTSLQLFLPYLRTNIRKFCPRKNIKKNSVLPFIGKYFWNDLPLSIRNITSKILFYFAH